MNDYVNALAASLARCLDEVGAVCPEGLEPNIVLRSPDNARAHIIVGRSSVPDIALACADLLANPATNIGHVDSVSGIVKLAPQAKRTVQ